MKHTLLLTSNDHFCTSEIAAFWHDASLSLRPNEAIVALWLGDSARTSTCVARRSKAAERTSLFTILMFRRGYILVRGYMLC